MDHLSLDITTTPEVITVTASGEIDMATVDHLKETLTALCVDGATVRLDMRDVTFMDSTGINALVIMDRHSKQGGGRLVLSAPSPRRAPAPRLHGRWRSPRRRRTVDQLVRRLDSDTAPASIHPQADEGAVMRAVSLVWKRSPTHTSALGKRPLRPQGIRDIAPRAGGPCAHPSAPHAQVGCVTDRFRAGLDLRLGSKVYVDP